MFDRMCNACFLFSAVCKNHQIWVVRCQQRWVYLQKRCHRCRQIHTGKVWPLLQICTCAVVYWTKGLFWLSKIFIQNVFCCVLGQNQIEGCRSDRNLVKVAGGICFMSCIVCMGFSHSDSCSVGFSYSNCYKVWYPPFFVCVCVCFPPFFSLTEMDLWIDSQFDYSDDFAFPEWLNTACDGWSAASVPAGVRNEPS